MKIYHEITLPSDLKILRKIGELVEFSVNNFSENFSDVAYYLNLATTEALSNAIKHGGKKEIVVKIKIENFTVKIDIIDKENKLNEIPNIKSTDIEDESGRGLFIISKIVDKMEFKQLDNSTVFTIIKYLKHDNAIAN